jgi:putative transposase
VPAALVRRAKMILLMDDGETSTAVARRFRLSRPTLTVWRTRYRENAIADLRQHVS